MNGCFRGSTIRTLSVLALSLVLLLGGCGSASGPGTASSSGAVVAADADLMAKVRAAKWPDQPKEPERAFVDSVGRFSWTLFQKAAEQKGNRTLSPASVYLALAMTANGADGTTRAAMLKAMAAEGLSLETVNAACRDWMTLLTQPNDAYGNKSDHATRVNMANSIWYDRSFTASPDFLQVNADHFAAAARQLDFDHAESVQAINRWASQATSGKIPTIIDRIEPNEVMFLINAVYFKSVWQKQFEGFRTHSADFFAETGTVSTSYISDERPTPVLDRDGLRGVLLPFLNPRFAFLAVLPPEGTSVRSMIAGLDAAAFERLLNSRRETTVTLDLPKFEATDGTDLKAFLTSMGMGEAFGGGADFSKMEKNHTKGLFITGVKHKAWIKIDEFGAEAAGLTGVTMAGAIIRKDENHLIFDRPFLYGIVDLPTGLPLFLGIMDNPTR